MACRVAQHGGRWLLLAATIVGAACRPASSLDDEPGDTDPTTTTGDGGAGLDDPPAEPGDTTAGEPECLNPSQCPVHHSCIDGTCVPEDCLYETPEGDCCWFPECEYEDCRDDAECDSDQYCGTPWGCESPKPLPECDGRLELVPLPLPEPSAPQLLSVSLVDVDAYPGHELILMQGQAIELLSPHASAPAVIPSADGGDILDVASADLDGDGLTDLVMTDDAGHITVMLGTAEGSFAPQPAGLEVEGATRLEPLQFDSDGAMDLLVLRADGGAELHFGGRLAQFHRSAEIPTPTPIVSLDVGVLGGVDNHDFALQNATEGQLHLGNSFSDPASTGLFDRRYPHAERHILLADLDGDGIDETFGYSAINDFVAIERWKYNEFLDDGDAVFRSASMAGAGDLDGDGLEDIVLAGGATATLLLAEVSEDSLEIQLCQLPLELPLSASQLLVGDLDGDARAEIVLSDGRSVLALTSG